MASDANRPSANNESDGMHVLFMGPIEDRPCRVDARSGWTAVCAALDEHGQRGGMGLQQVQRERQAAADAGPKNCRIKSRAWQLNRRDFLDQSASFMAGFVV